MVPKVGGSIPLAYPIIKAVLGSLWPGAVFCCKFIVEKSFCVHRIIWYMWDIIWHRLLCVATGQITNERVKKHEITIEKLNI